MSLATQAGKAFSKLEKKLFEKSLGPLLGSKRLIKRYSRQNFDYTAQLFLFIGFLISAIPIFQLLNVLNKNTISTILQGILIVVAWTYLACVVLLWGGDLDAIECYLLGYDSSLYALASGVQKSILKHDKGLIGEYKSYVLSRQLKIPHKILFNVCIPMPNGNFQEVDCILITRNIVYVLECKNRGGRFVGKINEPEWKQYIGGQEHDCKNIYTQNQKHTMALDRFLLDAGIIKNGQNVCINTIFSVGEMSLSIDEIPLDFLYGDRKHILRFIEKNDKSFDDGTDTTPIMNAIYEALLPYALYTPQERKMMMEQRDVRSKTEFSLGPFKESVIPNGIPGVTLEGEPSIIRYNKVYTQLQISNSGQSCWQTRTDIPSEYMR